MSDQKVRVMEMGALELDYAKVAAQGLLDNIARPAFLVTRDCTLVHMNGRAKRAVEIKRGLMATPAGRLVLEERTETAELHHLIAEVALNESSQDDFLTFSVSGELSPNSLLMHPFGLTSNPSPPDQRSEPAHQVLVTVHYRKDTHHFSEERARVAFGFTCSEVQVVLALAAGRKMSELAEETNRSVHTVRLHLKRALSKADCHSQSELMNVLFRIIGQPI